MEFALETTTEKVWFWFGVFLLGLFLPLFIAYQSLFGATQIVESEVEIFTVPLGREDQSEIIKRLKQEGYVRSAFGFGIALSRTDGSIEPGAYRLRKDMNAWEVAEVLTTPYMKWVVIPEGLRKEEIANRLAEALDWSESEKEVWIYRYTAMDYEYLEGVYFPDTYLIPVDESGLEVAERFQRRFEEQFAPYYQEFLEQNIKWTTGLTFASVIQREAAGKGDMSLIAGILWNRLEQDMKLEVDATVQYVRDEEEGITSNFWQPIKPEDKEIDSQYNTYKYEGLPPFPICNPGLGAIEAVLNPQETACLYYLHAPDRQIYCSETYEGHEANIEKYLR